jgi:hypothetical protein
MIPGVDHWLHVALGFQGIVGMMNTLDAHDVPPSEAALEMLEKYSRQLAEHVVRQKAKGASPKKDQA